MTIAACYVLAEGVVLGADSTTTNFVPHPSQPTGETHHFNFGQKILEVGENSTIGIASWGLGSLGNVSYRTIVAQLGDEFRKAPPRSMQDVAWRWASLFWNEYCRLLAEQRRNIQEIQAKGDQASEEEKKTLDDLIFRLTTGFCIGGHTQERKPEAYEIWCRPNEATHGQPQPIALGYPRFWGWSNLMSRLNYGMDDSLLRALMNSGKWNGTQDELAQIAIDNRLAPFVDLPLRDAIDWVYFSIYTSIKAIKFSHFAPVCGGPIELAVITTDRNFRWVSHKKLDAALGM